MHQPLKEEPHSHSTTPSTVEKKPGSTTSGTTGGATLSFAIPSPGIERERLISHTATSSEPATLKILMLGESGVGKSALLSRFADDVFEDQFVSTVGVDFKAKMIEVDGRSVQLQIWDTAGQERFRTITSSYYRGANGIVIVYDLTAKPSFEKLQFWMAQVKENTVAFPPIVIIGNKLDLAVGDFRAVTTEEGVAYADGLGVLFKEASAKTGQRAEEAFMHLAREILLHKSMEAATTEPQPSGSTDKVLLKLKEVTDKTSSCC